MFIERAVREEMNALSKEVFGVSSKWKSLLDHGINEAVTETTPEVVPGENGEPDRTEEVKVPVTINGNRLSRHKSFTLEEIKELMLKMKKQRDDFIAKMKAQQAQKELEKRVNDVAKGA